MYGREGIGSVDEPNDWPSVIEHSLPQGRHLVRVLRGTAPSVVSRR
jgi:hypothetical protein